MTNKMETTCPECRSRLRFTLDDVAKQRMVRCSRGHRVKMQDEAGGARKVSKALTDLDKAIKKLSR